VFAVLLAAVGLGSVAFHGPQPGGSRFLHDAPILLTVLFILSYDLALLSPRLRRWWVVFSAAAGIGVVVSAISPDAGVALTGIAIVAVAATELLVYRRHLRPAAVGTQRRRYLIVLGVVAVAVATWLLGRTESPACDPDDVVQFHGLWHALSAAVFVTWWWLAIGAEPNPTAPERTDQRSGTMAT
jgi:hypothetical protein